MVATPAQLVSVIRFQLSELKARNAHHQFEHLCRHLTRLRIYSNVLPATGPVGAGGDGGRDFETFKSTLEPEAILQGSNFVRLSSGARKIVFSCSLQETIESKIRSDVREILSTDPVDEIVYFCESNLPVAKRHNLERWADSEHEAKLQVFDGQAIAELLSDRDTFWIAQEYLSLPAELMPRDTDNPDWYLRALATWKDRLPLPFSRAHFVEIKWALRRATFDVDARQDLPLWISRMERFIEPDVQRALQRAAMYEVAVASLRGMGEMTWQLDRVRNYYSDFEDRLNTAELQDATTLMVYAATAWRKGEFVIEASELFSWRSRLSDCVAKQLSESSGSGRKSVLMQMQGRLALIPVDEASQPRTEDAFDIWLRMLDEVDRAPLFPVEEFSEMLARLTPLVGKHLKFSTLTGRVDDIVAQRSGYASAAEKMLQRADAYLATDDLLNAIRELHRIQFSWFTHDTLDRFQHITILLARCYGELQLPYAAKYFALAAAYVARYSEHDSAERSMPEALFAAASADNSAGNFLSYVQLAELAFEEFGRLDPDPTRFTEHPDIQEDLGQLAALRGLASRAGPPFVDVVDKRLGKWPEVLRSSIVEASNRADAFWNEGSWDDAWKSLEESFLSRPFGDLQRKRRIQWQALGLTWIVEFDNDYTTTSAVEQYVAQLQIAAPAFAGVDLCLLSTDVYIELSVAPTPRTNWLRVAKRYNNLIKGVQLVGALPNNSSTITAENFSRETVASFGAIVRSCSVLPDEDLREAVRPCAKNALGRVFLVRPYDELYREFLPEGAFHADLRQTNERFGGDAEFTIRQAIPLKWFEGPGPTYSKSVALDAVSRRYERGQKSVGITVQRLMGVKTSRELLKRSIGEGKKDWEVLSVIANAATNVRVPWKEDGTTPEQHLERFKASFSETETPATALSPAFLTSEIQELNQKVFLGAFLNGWGLTSCEACRDMDALEEFLIRRYGLRSDDVEHPRIFGI